MDQPSKSTSERRRVGNPMRLAAGATREPPKERLTLERIVDTAMELMSAKGYDAVSMRSMATALDTGPASLYAHVANREHVDQLVLDRIASQLALPVPDPDRWAEQLKDLMRQMLELYRAHPGSARAAMAIIPTGLGAVRAMEGMLALCTAGGISPQAAAWFCDLAPQYVGSCAVEELIWAQRENSTKAGEEPDHAAIDEQMAGFFESLPAESFPLVTSMARVLNQGDDVDRFEFGLDVLVAGLAAVSSRYA